ncbi:hypothetical protein [Corallococcus sp. 4LFB]|uniref:hypothetical protein n=1 Tax=Corallococcus sp. 4LFB TaxID=3383249 RepID=UPI003976C7E9
MTTKRNAPAGEAHKWEFKARFRRHAFGWKSQPAITRIKQAVAEIKKVAKKDAVLAAEGAVVFLERVSPALEHVDSSSGAIGTAVNNAIAELVPTIANAPADAKTRDSWLERLFAAYQDDGIPYIEWLGDHWGTLCASKEVASAWADRLIGTVKLAWSPDPSLRGFFKGTTNCLSALVAAERYDDVLALLELAPYKMWHSHQYGVKALAAMGKKAEALSYAAEGRGLNDSPIAIARACEEVLLSSGLVDEAYRRYGLEANQAGTYLATFRAVAKRYPHKPASEILGDLVKTTPGAEGKWFAAAKDAGLYDEASRLRVALRVTRRRSRGQRATMRTSSPRSGSVPGSSPCTGSCRATAMRSPAPMCGTPTARRWPRPSGTEAAPRRRSASASWSPPSRPAASSRRCWGGSSGCDTCSRPASLPGTDLSRVGMTTKKTPSEDSAGAGPCWTSAWKGCWLGARLNRVKSPGSRLEARRLPKQPGASRHGRGADEPPFRARPSRGG